MRSRYPALVSGFLAETGAGFLIFTRAIPGNGLALRDLPTWATGDKHGSSMQVLGAQDFARKLLSPLDLFAKSR